MTDPAIDAWRTRLDELAADAVRAMTAAARTPSPVGDRPLDFADFAARVLSAVAANLGGTVQLLAGRPGSWEADLVARLVNGTVGWSGEYLAEHRLPGTDRNDTANEIVPECPECGAPYGQAHDPTCTTRGTRAVTWQEPTT